MSVQQGFRAHKQHVKRRLYTVCVAFDTGDPALTTGDATAAKLIPPSKRTLAAIEAGKARATAIAHSATQPAPEARKAMRR